MDYASIIAALIGAGGAYAGGKLAPRPSRIEDPGNLNADLQQERKMITGQVGDIKDPSGDYSNLMQYVAGLGVPDAPTMTGGAMPFSIGNLSQGNTPPGPLSNADFQSAQAQDSPLLHGLGHFINKSTPGSNLTTPNSENLTLNPVPSQGPGTQQPRSGPPPGPIGTGTPPGGRTGDGGAAGGRQGANSLLGGQALDGSQQAMAALKMLGYNLGGGQ